MDNAIGLVLYDYISMKKEEINFIEKFAKEKQINVDEKINELKKLIDEYDNLKVQFDEIEEKIEKLEDFIIDNMKIEDQEINNWIEIKNNKKSRWIAVNYEVFKATLTYIGNNRYLMKQDVKVKKFRYLLFYNKKYRDDLKKQEFVFYPKKYYEKLLKEIVYYKTKQDNFVFYKTPNKCIVDYLDDHNYEEYIKDDWF